MSAWEPDFDPDNNSENMQSLVGRFAKAGWITGKNLVTPGSSHLTFTDKGKQRIGIVTDAWRAAWPEFFEAKGMNLPQRSPLEQLQQAAKLGPVLIELAKVAEELRPPEFTSGETDSLNALFVYIAAHGFPGEGQSWKFPGR